MINSTEYTARQVDVIKRIKKHFGKKNPVSRAELVVYMQEHEKQAYAPGFIVKNEAFKAKDKEGKELRGMYYLPPADSLKVSATAKAKAAPKKATKTSSKKTKGTETTAAPEAVATTTVPKRKKAARTQEAKDRSAALMAAAQVVEPSTEEAEIVQAATN
jgi:hypothetical protein